MKAVLLAIGLAQGVAVGAAAMLVFSTLGLASQLSAITGTRGSIRLYGGVNGSADAAVQALLDGTLQFDPAVHCDHHGEHHGEGHTCGHQGGAASCHQGGCGH